MISSEHLSKRIDEFLNKSGTNDNFKISLPAKVRAINSAQLILIKRKIGLNNVYKRGFESFRKRYDDLDFLIKDTVEVPLEIINGQLYADTGILDDYMFYIKSVCFADKGDCKNRRLRNYLVKRTDLENYIQSDTHMPSFEWQEQLVTMADRKLQVYVGNDYTVTKLCLDYIRQPIDIDIRGYKKNGVDSQTIDCEFPPHLEDELLDIVVEQLAMTITDQAQIQFAQSRQQRNE